MTRRILLLGATGYTGGRTAEAMIAAGVAPVLAGRDEGRLEALSVRLGGLETSVVDVTEPDQLAWAIRAGDVIVNTAGPFSALGAPVLRAALDAGAVYLDSTGESPFIRDVFERYGERAERAGATLVTAFGSDWVPGNLAGALALEAAGGSKRPVATVQIGYFLAGHGRPAASRGTVQSVVGMALAPGYRFVDGGLREEAPGVRRRDFDIDGTSRTAVSVGGSEQFGLPRLSTSLAQVDVFLGWLGDASTAVSVVAPAAGALARVPGVAGLAARLGSAAAKRVPTAPDPEQIAGVRSAVVAESFDRYGTLLSRVQLDGPEPYALTAQLLAHGSAHAAEHGLRGAGALGPVEAFGLEPLLEIARSSGLTPR